MTCNDKPLRYILKRRLVQKQIEILEYKTCFKMKPCNSPFRNMSEIKLFTVKQKCAAVCALKKINTSQRSRLSRTAWADDRNYFAFVYTQVEMRKHLFSTERFR